MMKKQSTRNIISLSIVLTVFVLVTLACGSSTPTSLPTVSTATSQGIDNSQTITDTTVPISPTVVPASELYLGDAVQKNGYALTTLNISDPAKPGIFYTAEAGKKLIAIEVNVSNLSGDELGVNPMYFELLDKDGYKYSSGLGDIEYQIGTVELSKGEQAKGWISFIIPENSTPATITYSPSMLGETIQASLTTPPSGHTPISVSLTLNSPSSKLGDVVEQFGYTLIVKTVEDPTNPGSFYTSRDGYKPVAVEIELANISGSSSLSANPLYTYVVDNNGFVYSAEIFGRDGGIDALDLNVGERVIGWVMFVIPNDATIGYVKYQTEIFSNNFLIAGASN